ncbi:hypothetical protein D9M72_632610 [compost metagenome]
MSFNRSRILPRLWAVIPSSSARQFWVAGPSSSTQSRASKDDFVSPRPTSRRLILRSSSRAAVDNKRWVDHPAGLFCWAKAMCVLPAFRETAAGGTVTVLLVKPHPNTKHDYY